MLAPRAKRPNIYSSTTHWPSSAAADEGPASAWRASVDLEYQTRDEQTIPTLRRHSGPLRVLKGYRQSGADCWEQVLVHPPGGIAACDRLDVRVKTCQDARVLVTTPGASKWYRCIDPAPGAKQLPPAQQTVTINIADRSRFEWLPLENIFYVDAFARLDSHFDVAPEAALIAGDVYCLGQPASAIPFERGRLQMHTRVSRANRPIFIERTKLLGGSRALTAPAGLNGYPCFGTLLAVPALSAGAQTTQRDDQHIDALGKLRDLVREALADQKILGEVAVTALPQVLVVRWRGPGAEAGWHALRAAWQVLRQPVLGCAAQAPRIWAC